MNHRALGFLFTAIVLLTSPLSIHADVIGPSAGAARPSASLSLAVVQKFTEMRNAGDFAGAYKLFLPGDLMSMKTPEDMQGKTLFQIMTQSREYQ